MATISTWINQVRPDLLVADVSAEVAVLSRLHGVPVVSVVLPGDRSDPAHLLGYRVSSQLVGFWPATVTGIVRGLPVDVLARLRAVGALSRFPVASVRERRHGPLRVTLMLGAGGSPVSAAQVRAARNQTPEWEWSVLGHGTWTDDPFARLLDSDVVVTHAGENAVAEVAAARRPAVVVPARRPHAEQHATARTLRAQSLPAIVETSWPAAGWADRLVRASHQDGRGWDRWCDGDAAERFAQLLQDELAEGKRRAR